MRVTDIHLATIKRRCLAERAVDTPCNGCRECCIGDAIFLHPECGDDAAEYRTTTYEGRIILQHKTNGECIYLGPDGCTIHARAPVICRELDCRRLVAIPGFRRHFPKQAARRLIKAAKRLQKRVNKHDGVREIVDPYNLIERHAKGGPL